MDLEQALLEQVRSLTPKQQQEVLDFAPSAESSCRLEKGVCTRIT